MGPEAEIVPPEEGTTIDSWKGRCSLFFTSDQLEFLPIQGSSSSRWDWVVMLTTLNPYSLEAFYFRGR